MGCLEATKKIDDDDDDSYGGGGSQFFFQSSLRIVQIVYIRIIIAHTYTYNWCEKIACLTMNFS